MSHSVTITRNELISILAQSYDADDEIDLQELAGTFSASESKMRMEAYLEDLLVSTYMLHSTNLTEVVTLPLDVEDGSDLAVPLVRAISSGALLGYLKPNEILIDTRNPDVIQEILASGRRTSMSEYDPANIRLAIYVSSDLDAILPDYFDEYDCTKIHIVI